MAQHFMIRVAEVNNATALRCHPAFTHDDVSQQSSNTEMATETVQWAQKMSKYQTWFESIFAKLREHM